MSDPAGEGTDSLQERLKAAETLTFFDALDAAEALYLSIADDDPYAGAMGLGMVAYRRRDYPQAVSRFDRALELRRDDFEALLARGVALLAMGRARAALADFEAANRVRGGTGVGEAARGRALVALGRFLEAEVAFRRAVHRIPQDYDVHMDLARALLAQGRVMEAVEALNTAASKDPQRSDAHLELAGIMSSLGGSEQAAGLLGEITDAMPDDPDLLYPLALLELKLGRNERVLELAGRIEGIVAEQADTLVGLAKLRLAADDRDGAGAKLERAVAIDPSQAEAWYMLGQVYDLQKRPNDAFQAFYQSAKLKPNDWRAYSNMAAIALDAQDDTYLEKAEQLIQAAQRVSTTPHPEVLFNQAMLLRRRGQTGEARQLLARLAGGGQGDSFVVDQARQALIQLASRPPMPEA